MAATPGFNATGITVAFSTSSWVAEIVDVTPFAKKRPALDTSHMGTSGSRTFVPGALTDNGEMALSVHFDPSTPCPMAATNTAETVTITFPMQSGKTTAAKIAFAGFITEESPKASLESIMQSDIKVKIASAMTVTAAA